MRFLTKGKERVHAIGAWFLRGILVQAPIIVVLAIAGFFIAQAERWLGPFFAFIMRSILPDSWLTGVLDGGHVPGLPLILWLVFTVVLGRFALWRIGQRGLMLVDHVFLAVPGIRTIYKFVRDIVSTISDKKSFQRVVWVGWPHQNTLTLGLVSQEIVDTNSGERWLACFVASVPNTTTGYVNLYREKDVWDAQVSDEVKERLSRPMTVSEAMSMLISLGTKVPTQMPIMPQVPSGRPPRA
ncbi:MAG: DUF502 domain-containing protein [Cyanobacteria bacterium]|nr:DUF502 domain-containing protein [Cyanobacteriota bacterium]